MVIHFPKDRVIGVTAFENVFAQERSEIMARPAGPDFPPLPGEGRVQLLHLDDHHIVMHRFTSPRSGFHSGLVWYDK
jgi:hypothetical protein